jgi:GNAT superfamily N-acetyltransferase
MQRQGLCRRLVSADAEMFQALRLRGFLMEPRAFRFAPEDEAAMSRGDIEARLARDHVMGAFDEEKLVGIGGLAWSTGAKPSHKALVFGMYVEDAYRGIGVADAIMRSLIETGASRVEILLLTVVATNLRALRFYERWGFRAYGVETRSVKFGEYDYLDETLMARDCRRTSTSPDQVFIESKNA